MSHPLATLRKSSALDQPADVMGDNFEGDILLSEEQIAHMKKRTGMYLPTFIWTDSVVPYQIVSSDFTFEQTTAIQNAMRTIEQHTCIRFVPATTSTVDYIQISAGTGCSSFVGRVRGAQTLRLQPSAVGTGCFTHGTIIHELIHALGFYHMQSATERDQYVDILWENITPGRESNFQAYGTDRIINYGVAYDYDSIMHYNTHAFSANGQPTILPKVPNVTIGQREAMSPGDIQRIWNIRDCLSPVSFKQKYTGTAMMEDGTLQLTVIYINRHVPNYGMDADPFLEGLWEHTTSPSTKKGM
uniref:Metalloendopeptidase n=1 Tax=Anopheles culicifacies TaxID=139723 RepID=A0A182MCY9_9DIPT